MYKGPFIEFRDWTEGLVAGALCFSTLGSMVGGKVAGAPTSISAALGIESSMFGYKG